MEGPAKDLYKLGKPVPAKAAGRCKLEFEHLMITESNRDLLYYRFKHSKTTNVTFTGQDLLDWLTEMIALGPTVVNNIRVVFGIYDPPFANEHHPGKSDRLSVFLWPYLNNEPAKKPTTAVADPEENLVPPYNLGGLQP